MALSRDESAESIEYMLASLKHAPSASCTSFTPPVSAAGSTSTVIAREDSSTLGPEVTTTPKIREPEPEEPLHTHKQVLAPRRPSVRKAKSYHTLSAKASKSSPNLLQEQFPDSPKRPSQRERKTSGFGLGLSWSALAPSTSRVDLSHEPRERKQSLPSKRSFSFLRRPSSSNQLRSTQLPPSPTLPLPIHDTPQASPTLLAPPTLQDAVPSLPALDFATDELGLPTVPQSATSAASGKSSLLSRTRSGSLGKWGKSLRDAVSSQGHSPPMPPMSRSRSSTLSSSSFKLRTSAEHRSRSRSHASTPPHSMPSSPLATSSDLEDPQQQPRDRTLTFALPEQKGAGSPLNTSTDMRRSRSAGTPNASDSHLPLKQRRGSVASALQSLNPFHSASKQSLHGYSSDDLQRDSLHDSPSEEPDLATLIGQHEQTQKDFDLSRKRSASANSSSAWSLGSVFGRRRASSVLSLSQPQPHSDSLLTPSAAGDDGHHRASTSSVNSTSSYRSDLYSPTSTKWPASAAASTVGTSTSASSSRKPSMVFSKQPTRSSLSSLPHSPSNMPSPPKEDKPPRFEQDDTPESYLLRLEENCSKAHVAKLLASSSEPFYAQALRLYMSRFAFKDLPIDMALRKLLMELYLPRETQQIDRVMEAFAAQYQQENPQVLASSDQCYILAFSLIMLHTDAFNSHNKNKMSKEDYTKNTRIDGVPVELLEYLYDNTVYAPYMFVDSLFDINSRDQPHHLTAALSSGLTSGKEKAKLEVYQMIINRQTRRLRVGVQHHIPFKNPYSFTGTVPFFNSSELQTAFVNSYQLLLPSDDRKPRSSDALVSIASPTNEASGIGGIQMAALAPATTKINFVKAGILLRKDELVEGGKRASSRKWREWTVMLTPSQLVFFKEPQWAELLLAPAEESEPDKRVVELPPGRPFKHDGVLPLEGFVAIYDFSFTKRANTFMLVAESGQQLLFQAADAADMNEWIGLINWAASFKNTGVKLRTEMPVEASLRRPHASHASTMSNLSTLSQMSSSTTTDNQTRRMIYSAQGKVIGSAPGGDPAWSDDHVFEQFTQADLSHLGGGRATRTDIVRSCIADLDQQIASEKANLQRDIQQARLLDILQPFSGTTRNRLAAIVTPLARRVKNIRLKLCRLTVSREVLARDLLSEERDATRALMLSNGSSGVRPNLRTHQSDFGLLVQSMAHSSNHSTSLQASHLARSSTESPLASFSADTSEERALSNVGSELDFDLKDV